MSTPLGDFVKSKRDRAGWSQARLAEEVGTSPAYISQIESGRVSLPGADLRRGIAKAIGVCHLDLLVESGELTRDELESTVGVIERRPDDPAEQLIEAIRSAGLNEDEVGAIRNLVSFVTRQRKPQPRPAVPQTTPS